MGPSTLLVLLILADVGLMVAFFLLSRKQSDQSEVLRELSDERRLLNEMRREVKDEFARAQTAGRELLEKMNLLAAEAEQEVRAASTTIGDELKDVVAKLSQKFDNPITRLTKAEAAIDGQMRRLQLEKSGLQKMLGRAERVCSALRGGAPFDEIMTDIEDKKYSDALHLLSKGVAPEKVAEDVGIAESEVRLIRGMGQRLRSGESTKSIL